MSAPTIKPRWPEVIPLALTRCCRDWIVAFGVAPWGRCGRCGTKPAFVRALPEEEWLRIPNPRRNSRPIRSDSTPNHARM